MNPTRGESTCSATEPRSASQKRPPVDHLKRSSDTGHPDRSGPEPHRLTAMQHEPEPCFETATCVLAGVGPNAPTPRRPPAAPAACRQPFPPTLRPTLRPLGAPPFRPRHGSLPASGLHRAAATAAEPDRPRDPAGAGSGWRCAAGRAFRTRRTLADLRTQEAVEAPADAGVKPPGAGQVPPPACRFTARTRRPSSARAVRPAADGVTCSF